MLFFRGQNIDNIFSISTLNNTTISKNITLPICGIIKPYTTNCSACTFMCCQKVVKFPWILTYLKLFITILFNSLKPTNT